MYIKDISRLYWINLIYWMEFCCFCFPKNCRYHRKKANSLHLNAPLDNCLRWTLLLSLNLCDIRVNVSFGNILCRQKCHQLSLSNGTFASASANSRRHYPLGQKLTCRSNWLHLLLENIKGVALARTLCLHHWSHSYDRNLVYA